MKSIIEKLCADADSNQRRAIVHDPEHPNPLLVLAGPGSGKTRVLTHRLLFLILSGVTPSSILALTFTEAAAKEMQERVNSDLTRYNLNAESPNIRTFHSLSLQIIWDTINGIANWKRLGYPQKPTVETDSSSKDNTSLSFSDMISKVTVLLEQHEDVRRYYQQKFSHILIDEFQDTNPNQLQFAEFFSARFFFVGDDDQAIYKFRGADGNLEQLLKKHPQADIIKLETNYRSTPNIVEYAQTLLKDKPHWLRKQLRSSNLSQTILFKENSKVSIRLHRKGLDEVKWLAQEIKNLKAQYSLKEEHFAILFRLNSQRQYYQDSLSHFLGSEVGEKISLLTIHKSKGLEFPVVFLVGLENTILPYFEKGEKISQESLAEEKRLFYVAVTRAQSKLYLSAVRRKTIRGKIKYFKTSPFLLEAGPLNQRIQLRIYDMLIS